LIQRAEADDNAVFFGDVEFLLSDRFRIMFGFSRTRRFDVIIFGVWEKEKPPND
jgi:hypothetical protein